MFFRSFFWEGEGGAQALDYDMKITFTPSLAFLILPKHVV